MSIDSYRFLDFASRQVMKAWASRERVGVIPFAPLSKPLRDCTIALVSTAGIACNDDRPFDQEHERRDPWWGDPSFRVIPLGSTEADVRICPLGNPHDAAGQRAVLRALLEVLPHATPPDTYVELPFEWPDTPAHARNESKDVPPAPIVDLVKRKPWLLPNLYSGRIPRREEEVWTS